MITDINHGYITYKKMYLSYVNTDGNFQDKVYSQIIKNIENFCLLVGNISYDKNEQDYQKDQNDQK